MNACVQAFAWIRYFPCSTKWFHQGWLQVTSRLCNNTSTYFYYLKDWDDCRVTEYNLRIRIHKHWDLAVSRSPCVCSSVNSQSTLRHQCSFSSVRSLATEEPISSINLTTGMRFFTLYCQSSDTHETRLTTSHWSPAQHSDTFYSFSCISVREKKPQKHLNNCEKLEIGKPQCNSKLLVSARYDKLTVEPSLPPLLRLFFLWLDFLLHICENKRRRSATASVTLC